ncbi:MAG: hypothetical protein LBG87_07985 [Spirochaetaceae bacterium]|jgi:hypothetical protein|nr:hypothetical protein [Spirochaetaceae bacterium]
MKWFICAFDGVFLGIPGDQISRLFIAPPETESAGPEKPLSISKFFRRNVPTPHAASLKRTGQVLLLPRIQIDMDLPDEKISPMPKAFGENPPFSGAYFRENDLILFLNFSVFSSFSKNTDNIEESLQKKVEVPRD